jgi:hypothetical protein
VPCRRAPGNVIVQVRGHVVLEEFPQVLDDQLGSTCILVLLEALVDADNIYQLMSKIVLGTLPVLEDDGGSHRDRGDGQHREYRPFRTCHVGIYPEMPEVFIRDLLETGTYGISVPF